MIRSDQTGSCATVLAFLDEWMAQHAGAVRGGRLALNAYELLRSVALAFLDEWMEQHAATEPGGRLALSAYQLIRAEIPAGRPVPDAPANPAAATPESAPSSRSEPARACRECGSDISDRQTHAKYCLECAARVQLRRVRECAARRRLRAAAETRPDDDAAADRACEVLQRRIRA